MKILIIISMIISPIALLLSILALHKINDHEVLNDFTTQPTVIKYPDLDMIEKQNGVYDLKKRVKKLEEDVSVLKFESAVDDMDINCTIDTLKGMLKNKCCEPTELEMAAVKLAIDSLESFFVMK